MGGVFNAVNLQLYHYAGNNPVKYVDPDGREIKINKIGTSQSHVLYEISMTAVLINNSGEDISSEQLADIAAQISLQIESSFQGSDDCRTFKTTVVITIVDSEAEIKPEDHVFRLVDNDDSRLYGAVGIAYLGGKVALLSADLIGNIPDTTGIFKGTGKTSDGNGTISRTGAHETGHMLGLIDFLPTISSSKNLMRQTVYDEAGLNINISQLNIIRNQYDLGRLNLDYQNFSY